MHINPSRKGGHVALFFLTKVPLSRSESIVFLLDAGNAISNAMRWL
jgi:hypothetical protein